MSQRSQSASRLRNRSILLVCTGNTCRSPMAAALLRHKLAERWGNKVAAEVEVRSAGLRVARPGEPATAHALDAMAELGLSLQAHQAHQLNASDLRSPDLILTMTRAHREELRQSYPTAADRLFTLCEYTSAPEGAGRDIVDPIGGDMDEYRACRDQLEKELSRLVELIAGEEGHAMPTLEIAAEPCPALLAPLELGAEPQPELPVLRRLAVGADHAGYELKAELAVVAAELGCEVVDYGTNDGASCDYPDFAGKVAAAVARGTADAGLLVCGTGLGMAIAANKIRGIRAVTVGDLYTARLSRDHNDANVLCLGARIVGSGLAVEILRAFLATPFGGDRHMRRVRKIHDLEASGKDL